MVKQLIAAAIFLLIKIVPETIFCTCTIFDFTILTQYPLLNNETLFYIDDALYRFDKTKIVFENHCLIDAKLF